MPNAKPPETPSMPMTEAHSLLHARIRALALGLVALLALGLALLAPAARAANPEAEAVHRLHLDEAFAKLDIPAALAYLDAHAAEMKRDAPTLAVAYRCQALLWQGRHDEARNLRDEALKANPAIADDSHFKSLSEALNEVQDGPTKLSLDYGIDESRRAVQQAERDGQTLKLYRKVREVLNNSRDQVVLGDDPNLYLGAAAVYRASFAHLAEGYAAYLDDYIEALRRTGTLTATQLERQRMQLSLEPAQAAVPQPIAAGPPALPKSLGAPQPVGELADGCMEQLAAWDAPDRHIYAPQLGAPAIAGDLRIVQTSRQVLALRAGRPAWSYRVDPTNYDPNADEPRDRNALRVMPHAASADAAGRTVVARLMVEGAFHLLALSTDSGRRLWEAWPSDYTFCSDPTVWEDQVLVLARKTGKPSEYYLLSLDLATGEPLHAYFLCTGTPRIPFVRDIAHTIQFDLHMAAPLVDRDIAFIATNGGFAAAFDLARSSMLWARRYPSVPYALASPLGDLPIQRAVSAPVVGADTVLFAPIDALNLLAVDRLTGKSIPGASWLQWSAVRTLPPNRALIRSPDHKTLTVLKLADLSALATLPADTAWEWAADTQGRPLLRRGDQLGVLTDGDAPTFTPRGDLPADAQLLLADADRLLLARRELDGFTLLATNPAKAEPSAASPAGSPSAVAGQPLIREITKAYFQTIGDATYAVGDNALVRLTDDLRPQWAFTVPERPRYLVADGPDLLVGFPHYAFAVDGATGRPIRAYPAAGQPWAHLTAVGPGPDGLLIGVDTGHKKAAVLHWNHGDPTPFATFKDEVESVAAILQNGKSAVAHIYSRGIAFTLDEAAKRYTPVPDSSHWIDLSFSKQPGYFPSDGSFVYANDYTGGIRFDGTAISKIELTRKGMLSDHSSSYYFSHDILRTSIWDTKQLLYVIDLRARRDLSMELMPIRRPYVDDDLIVGMAAGDKKTVVPWIYDRQTGTRTDGISMITDKDRNAYILNRHYYPTDFQLRLGEHVYTVFGPTTSNPGRLVRTATIQNTLTNSLDVAYFPGFLDATDAVVRGDTVLLAVDDGLLRLSGDRFRALLSPSLSPLTGIVNRTYDCRVDGFPDDWPDAHFSSFGPNRYLVMSDLKTTFIAFDIRDPALIQRLCQPGVLDQLHLVYGPADVLAPTEFLARRGGRLASPLFKNPAPGLKAAYSVSPAGDRLFIEAVFTGRPDSDDDDLPYAKWSRVFIGGSPAADRLGDIAIDLQLPSADGRALDSVLAPADPTLVPRFRLIK